LERPSKGKINKELTMVKLENLGKVAVAVAVSLFLASFFTLGIVPRLMGAVPAGLMSAALQGELTGPPSVNAADLINAEDLVKILQSAEDKRPLLIYVGFHPLYTQAHIPRTEFFGPASNEAVVQQLRKRVEGLSRKRSIVVYCGCCPWNHCPNVKPAYEALRNWGFTKLKLLYIPNNLGTDWGNKGYPFEKGE
jgi:thiosulfate/3-mercaptopyruvate sulfurtransferase